jgi:hypothetical protein
MKQKNQRISQNTTLAELMKKKGAEKVLQKYNVPCLSCPMAKFEMDKLQIGEICKMYGLDLKGLLKDLND